MLPLLVRLMIVLIRMINTTIVTLVWSMILTVIWNKVINPYVLGTLRTIMSRLGWFFPLLKS